MKAKLVSIATYAFVILLLTNCTIEKRVFQKGYHIEWKKRTSNETAQSEPDKLTIVSDHNSEKQIQAEITGSSDSENAPLISSQKESETKSPSASTNPAEEPRVSTSRINSSESVTMVFESSTDQAETTPEDQKDDLQPENEPKTFEPAGIVSFGFYFLAWIVGLCAITAVNPVAILGFAALLLIASLILGIISVVRYRRNRERYHRNFFGYFGLIASGSTLILGLFILTFIVLGSLFYY